MSLENLDEHESYLREATILDAYAFPGGGGHADKRGLLLEGGVTVVAKPGTNASMEQMVGREVAAWHVARGLGWPELMGATVLRTVDELWPDTLASAQVVWTSCDEDLDPAALSEEDITKAAVFDAIVQPTDRFGHNWLGVPAAAMGGTPRLKLVDHGHAFDHGSAVQSTFYELRKDRQLLSDDILDAMGDFIATWAPEEARDLLPDEAIDQAEQRARAVAEAGRLAPAEE